MGSAFHQLCPRYSGTLTPTAPTANRLWKTFTLLIMPLTIWNCVLSYEQENYFSENWLVVSKDYFHNRSPR